MSSIGNISMDCCRFPASKQWQSCFAHSLAAGVGLTSASSTLFGNLSLPVDGSVSFTSLYFRFRKVDPGLLAEDWPRQRGVFTGIEEVGVIVVLAAAW